MNRSGLLGVILCIFCLIAMTSINARDPSSTSSVFCVEEPQPIPPVVVNHPPLNLSEGFLELTETLPPDRLTELATQSLNRAPVWLRDDLRDNLELMAPAYQDVYAQMILNPSDPRFTDEIAFCVANIAPELLQHAQFIPDLLEENAFYIYDHDQYLDYVRLVDVGEPGIDDHYYTTTFYQVEEAGIVTEYELDAEIYYWFIVHPKIEDEMVDYIDPASQSQHADPPVGVFWRDWIFTHTEQIPDSEDYYPVLRDALAGVPVLWKRQEGNDNGAISTITQWILDVMDFGSGAERPIQPVRIYTLHLGRCGEHQDITSAAARAALIPCLNTQAIGEDHVWNEFYDGRFIHWEPVNFYIDIPLVYENGWGKVFSGVFDVMGDGNVQDVIQRYSEGWCTVDVQVVDANGDPIDGAKVTAKPSGGYMGTYTFTGSDGMAHMEYGDGTSLLVRALTDIGKNPINGSYELTAATENGGSYTWTAEIAGTLPSIPVTDTESPPEGTTEYRLNIAYQVNGEVLRGYYEFDKPNHFSRRIPGGNIDFFIVDRKNWDAYSTGDPFQGYEITWRSNDNNVQFEMPYADTWTVVLTAERKLQCKQLLDVSVTLQESTGDDWQDLGTVTRHLELYPGERYAVSVELPPELGVKLEMPSEYYRPGDECYLTAWLGNPGDPIAAVPLFVLLDVEGMFFFWPEWKMLPDVSYGIVSLLSGTTPVEILPVFQWPAGVGSASGIRFMGAMTDPAMTELLGTMDIISFGWGE